MRSSLVLKANTAVIALFEVSRRVSIIYIIILYALRQTQNTRNADFPFSPVRVSFY